ncbi:MAG: ubiquitin-conjugating enzyme E2 [Methanomassiliicoccales archaeon]
MPLPREVLVSRLKNELAICQRCLKHPIEIEENAFSTFPLEIEMLLVQIPGYELINGQIRKRYHHRFSLTITADYPFQKPQVTWLTPIFHPNIMMPEDGGFLCNKLLDEWSFNSTLLMFIKGIEYLLLNPNPSSPFGTETCTLAAEYFNRTRKTGGPLISVPLPKVVREV